MAANLTRLLIISVALMLMSCTGEIVANGQVAQDEVRVLESGIRLPASATNVWLFQREDIEDLQKIRFDAPLGDARAFVRSLLGKDLVTGYDPAIQFTGPRLEWWPTAYPAGAEGGQTHGDNPAMQIVLVPRGERARVWVVVFTW